MVVIQRGGAGDVVLDERRGARDAAEQLRGRLRLPALLRDRGTSCTATSGAELQTAEREIVARALSGLQATLMRSETMDWATRLGALLGPAVKPVAIAGGAPSAAPEAVPGAASDA